VPQARSKPKWLPVGPFRITSHGTLFGLERAKKRRVGSLTSLQNMRCQMGRAVDHAEDGSTGLKLASSPVRCCLKMIAISALPKHLASRWRRAGLHSDPAF
jgi:hypothetical protein